MAAAFVVVLLAPSIAHAEVERPAPLCDFRGASIVVQAPDQLASMVSMPQVALSGASSDNVAALCDTRGATMIAPAPQLQSESTFLMLTPGTDDLSALLEHAVVPGHPGQDAPTYELSFPDPSMMATVPFVAPAPEIGRITGPATDDRAKDGVQSSLERPPRA